MVQQRRHVLQSVSFIQAGFFIGLLILAAAAHAASCDQASGASFATQSPAVAQWSRVIAGGKSTSAERREAYLRRGEMLRAMGRYRDAAADLEQALSLSRSAHDPLLETTALQALGQVEAAQMLTDKAAKHLEQALSQARRLGRPILTAACANALGNLHWDQGEVDQARPLYEEALAEARRTQDAGLIAAIRLNQSRLAVSETKALAALREARTAAARVENLEERVGLLLGIAEGARRIGPSGYALAGETLDAAASTARSAGLARSAAQALAGRSELESARGQTGAARGSIEQALVTAPINAHDLRYQWEWNLGRLWQDAGDSTRAIAAYRRAVGHLQKIRADIPITYPGGRSSFRETLEPLYLGLADLLLREAAYEGEGASSQALLREARDTVEQVKLDELRDYFRDACIVPLRESVETLSSRAAVLYPILFPDRLELLSSIGRKLYRVAIPVTRDQIEETVGLMAVKLRYDKPAVEEAEQLYEWLIAPLEGWLKQQSVDMLVFVPEGVFRQVPLAALSKNGHYLIEQYGVAIVPGLKLLQPEIAGKRDFTTLIAGLSRPGPVVDRLPGWWVSALVEQNRRALAAQGRGLRGVSVPVRGGDETTRLARIPESEKVAALSLPGVAKEIDALSRIMPGQTLRDQDFLLNSFVTDVGSEPFRIVHIASHGLFQGPPEENFIVTYDQKLDMKRLADTLKPKELAQKPIELLVLSACQTAEGDDRTPLGLSGVALGSGARSVVGSLWPVSDSATQLLMQHFYANLKEQQQSKGQALRQAQIALIKSGQFSSPSDWAAFILVGSWL